MKKLLLWLAFAGMLLVVMGLMSTSVRAQPEIVFGVYAEEDPAILRANFKPLADYLTAQTGVPFTLRVGKDFQSNLDEIGNGTVQIAFLTQVAYLVCERQNPDAKITPLVRFQRSGKGKFKACIIVPRDSAVKDVSALKSKTFAFGSKGSPASHLMPQAMLVAAGIDIRKDLAGYGYAGSHAKVVQAVAAKTFDAGGLHYVVAERSIAQGRPIRILATSADIPEGPLCVNKSLAPEMVEKIRVALLKLNDKSAASVAVVTAIDPKYKYDGVEEAKSADYDAFRDTLQKLYGDNFYKKSNAD